MARLLAARLDEFGLEARVQPLDTQQANALGRLPSDIGDGPDLLLYSPIDTHLAGAEAVDLPQAGEQLGAVHRNQASVRRWEVAGLGAEHPKGFAAWRLRAARVSVDLKPQMPSRPDPRSPSSAYRTSATACPGEEVREPADAEG